MGLWIVFIGSGLFLYWCTRMMMLLRGPGEDIAEALDEDLRHLRQAVQRVRGLFDNVLQTV